MKLIKKMPYNACRYNTIINDKIKLKMEDYTKEKGFWKRLHSFVNAVQVDDAMSKEEKDMILNVCTEKLNEVNDCVIPDVTNCYRLNKKELKAMKRLNSKIIKFADGSGIGIGIECLTAAGDWIDITDYSCW